ncbi:MAG: YihY/virulence factor BrkB family protein [Enterococcus sp.]
MNPVQKLQQNQKLKLLISTAKERITDAELGNTSIVVAYYLLLSLFPLLIAVGNLLPFLAISPDAVLPYVQEVFPDEIYQFLGPAISNLLTQSSGSLLSLSAIAALWSASQSINAMQIAMNKAYGVDNRHNFIIVRLVSILVIVLFMIAIVGATLVLSLGQLLLDTLQPIFNISTDIIQQFQTWKWPTTIFLMIIAMSLIYWIVPNAKVRVRSVLPGAVFATVGWMLLVQLFGIYAQYFASKISGYQIIGSFIVLMIWLNFAATVIVAGGVVNAIVEEYSTGHRAVERMGIFAKISLKVEHKVKNRNKSK